MVPYSPIHCSYLCQATRKCGRNFSHAAHASTRVNLGGNASRVDCQRRPIEVFVLPLSLILSQTLVVQGASPREVSGFCLPSCRRYPSLARLLSLRAPSLSRNILSLTTVVHTMLGKRTRGNTVCDNAQHAAKRPVTALGASTKPGLSITATPAKRLATAMAAPSMSRSLSQKENQAVQLVHEFEEGDVFTVDDSVETPSPAAYSQSFSSALSSESG